jgi:hypothetical protein
MEEVMNLLRFMVLPLLLLSFSFSAEALNLTGTWTGKFTCSGFDGVNFSFTQKNQGLKIRQPPGGNLLSVQWLDGEELAATFTGYVIDSITKPTTRGHAALADCATKADITTGVSEIADLNVTLNPNRGTGSLNGTSIYTDQTDDPENPNDRPEVTRCRWIFKLADPADPNIPAGCTSP